MNQDISTPDFLDLSDDSGFVKDSNDSIIKVIGVGGGGSNAVNYMYEQQIPHINFVICNTDEDHLKRSPVPTKVLIGKSITNGLGAGNIPEVGKKCAESSEEEIKALFDEKTEMVFITAGMGGGTGTGAAPIVAQLAKEAGKLTIGIVTIPFFFEGEKKIIKAIEGAEEMKKNVDAILVINNENLIDLYKDLNFFNAFSKADDTLANAARSISEIISDPCYVNVDFQDVKTTLKNSGTAIISTAIGEGEHRISEGIHNALHSPLLKKHDIYSSKRLLFKFMCWKDSPNPLRAEEFNEITQFTAKLPASIDVKWGIGDDPSLGDKVKITILASGFDMTVSETAAIHGVPKDSGSDKKEDEGIIILGNPEETPVSSRDEEARREQDAKMKIADMYGHDKAKEHFRASDEMKYVVLKPSQFDDFDVISLLEKTPTANRAPGFKDQIDSNAKAKPAESSSPLKPSTPGAITFGEGDW